MGVSLSRTPYARARARARARWGGERERKGGCRGLGDFTTPGEGWEPFAMPDPVPDPTPPGPQSPSAGPGPAAPVPPDPGPAPNPEPEPSAPPTPSGASGDPPAARVVLEGDLEEGDAAELVRLRQEREELARGRRAAEIRAAELEDQLHRAKHPPTPAARQKRSWLDGGTFFHQ